MSTNKKKNMKSRFWEFFQGLGKTFMLPVALMSFMGLLLGIGSAFTSDRTLEILPFLDQPVLQFIFSFMAAVGSFAFTYLPVMFAIAIPLGLARYEKGAAAFSGFVGYVVMNLSINFYLTYTNGLATEDLYKSGQGMILGIQSLDMGVLGGIIVGIVVHFLHTRNYNRRLPDAFAFFGGVRFVPIISAITLAFIGLLIPFIWPYIAEGINSVGVFIGSLGALGSFLFGFGERMLLPFGLHHILVSIIRFTPAGGTMVIDGETVSGALNIYYAQLEAGVTSFSGEATRFLSQGKMPTFMFGLVGAALAMYHTVPLERRKQVKGLFISGVIACAVTGITEPIEFLFLFVAPWLYFMHAVFTGLGFMIMDLLPVTIGNTDGGIIDFIIFGVLMGTDTGWYWVLIIGPIWFALYYFTFKWAILKYNFATPGRMTDEDENEMVSSLPVSEEEQAQTGSASKKSAKIDQATAHAAIMLKALGGKENIESIDNCITRLRLVVKDMSKLDEHTLKKNGAIGIIKLDEHNVQVVIGPQVGQVKQHIEALM